MSKIHSTLTTQDFNYHLPVEQIAQNPLPQRSSSKLCIRNQDGSIQHQIFHNLPELLPSNTLLVYNNTRVYPSRLKGQLQSGAKVELFLLHQDKSTTNTWQALARPMKKLAVGKRISFAAGCEATVMSRHDQTNPPTISVEFAYDGDIEKWLDLQGYIPLPPYIKRPEALVAPQSEDNETYQTVYSKHRGSVAAPTAGLHFDTALLEQLQAKGIDFAPITLHVGAGTFLPVKTSEIHLHPMHEEHYLMPQDSHKKILEARAANNPIVVVGTTSLRALEAFWSLETPKTDKWHSTDIFIYPKHREDIYTPKVASALITNFHQPESTLFMLICALIGFEQGHLLYREAIATGYRFFSYGDSSLLWLN